MSKYFGLFVVLGVYLLIFVLMQPLYNKAYDDDFAYVQSVKHLVVDGKFVVSQWAAVPLIFQILWGGLFAKLFGFSFVVLTFSTLVLLAFGLIAFYFTIRELVDSDRTATIFTLALLAFPWTLLFAYSFLSNVQYLSLFLISLCFYTRGINRSSGGALFIGSVFSLLAFLTRQTGIVLVPAALVAVFFQRRDLKSFFLAGIVPLVGFLIYELWLYLGNNQTFGQLFATQHVFWPTKAISMGLIEYFSALSGRFGYYISVIGAPLVLIFLLLYGNFKKSALRWGRRFFIPWGILTALVYLSFFGPIYFDDFALYLTEIPVPGTPFFFASYAFVFRVLSQDFYEVVWTALVVCSVPFVTSLIVFSALDILGKGSRFVFLFMGFVLLFLWTIILPTAWPEYSLSLVPFVILQLALISRKLTTSRNWITLVVFVMLFFTFLNTKMTHSIKGLLWQESEDLVQEGIEPGEIQVDMFAWYPWWEYESTFESDMNRIGWDMRRLTKLRRWRFPLENPKYIVEFDTQNDCGRHISTWYFEGYLCRHLIEP